MLFAVVMFVHHLPIAWRAKKTNLLVASYLFYAAWNPPFVILLWISTATDWIIGRAIHEASTTRIRRCLVATTLAVNLGLLCVFKYGGFLLENFVALFLDRRFSWSTPALNQPICPVG